jgi:DNA repair exonuclease SbcCD nuclease subunit
MRVALLGDTHFGARNDSPHFHTFFEKFYRDTFFPYLKEHGITNVVQMGDVFDRRKYINFQTLKSCRDYFFDPMVDQKITCHVIIGNHDTYYKNTNEVNSLTLLLREYSNVGVYEEPTELEFEDCKFLMVPWICQANEKQCLDAIAATDANVIVGHFEIAGFEMYRGAVCDEGMPMEAFAKHPMVLSGHFHHKSSHKNIQYLGTPYEITWSDFNDLKGFHIFDTDTKELTFVPNPNVMFHKVHYDDAVGSMDEVLSIDFEQYRGTIVKVIVRNKNNPHWFDMYVDKLEKAGVLDMQVVEDHFHLDLEADDDIVNEAEDTLTILNKYVDQMQIQGDRQRLDNLIRTLYHEALSVE